MIQPDWVKFKDGKWHHVVITNEKCYIDGVEQ